MSNQNPWVPPYTRIVPRAPVTEGLIIVDAMAMPRPQAYVSLGNEMSKSDARRLIKQGGVKIWYPETDEYEKVNHFNRPVSIGEVIRWGKYSCLLLVSPADYIRLFT